jgi:LysM repeat protein
VVIALERETGEATGLRVAYAHLDPVAIAVGDLVDGGGTLLGALGPDEAQDWGPEAGLSGHAHPPEDPRRAEYHSRCAQHSHLHLEGFGADGVMRARGRPGEDEPMMSFTAAGEVVAPDVVVESAASVATHIEATATVVVEAQPSTYLVEAGESLLEIAAKLGIPLAALVAANGQLVGAGDELVVPGQVYVVRPRDTLAEIAARFGVALAALVAVNAIDNPNRIDVGQVLTIPR